MKKFMKIAAAGAFALAATTTAAFAGITKQPGETAGLASGAPLPEGVYFVDTLSWGVQRLPGEDRKLLVNVPVIAWSTPWTVLGGNVQIIGALPHIHLDGPGGGAADVYGLYNPFISGRIAWDLGGGFGFSYLSGVYVRAGNKDVRVNAHTWRQDFAASYTGDGWNLTANLTWGITFDTKGIRQNGFADETSNGLGLDLTATKTFGKWEVGAVGFGSTEYDTVRNAAGNRAPKTKQFAVGPLVGYNFGPVILQAYLTRDVYARNTGGPSNREKETRAWGRIIIPLWTPETPAAPLVTKY